MSNKNRKENLTMQFIDLLSKLTTAPDTTAYRLATVTGLIFIVIGHILTKHGLVESGTSTAITGLALTIASIFMIAYVNSNKLVNIEYNLNRDKNYVYINSHNDRVESAKLEIIGVDKQTIYVTYKEETYKIPIMVNK